MNIHELSLYLCVRETADTLTLMVFIKVELPALHPRTVLCRALSNSLPAASEERSTIQQPLHSPQDADQLM